MVNKQAKKNARISWAFNAGNFLIGGGILSSLFLPDVLPAYVSEVVLVGSLVISVLGVALMESAAIIAIFNLPDEDGTASDE